MTTTQEMAGLCGKKLFKVRYDVWSFVFNMAIPFVRDIYAVNEQAAEEQLRRDHAAAANVKAVAA